ncbi:MAG: hypothetical protein AAB351_01120 [Patescibacteria group bacterium]
MSELEKTKNIIIKNIQRLCAHCVNGVEHDCPVRKITEQISGIRGVPLIVNDEFRGVIFR